MLAEFVKAIAKMATDATKTRVILPVPEPSHFYLLEQPDGTLTERRAQAPPTKYTLATMESLIEMCRKEDRGVCWVSRAGVVYHHDPADRRDVATLPFRQTPQILALQGLENNPRFIPQRDLIYLLRTTFKDSMALNPDLLKVIRSLSFQNGETVVANIQHAKQSVGKSLSAEISSQGGAIPEYFRLQVPVLVEFPGVRVTVEVALDVDPSSGNFRLTPLPGQIEAAFTALEDEVEAGLQIAFEGDSDNAVADVMVYRGMP